MSWSLMKTGRKLSSEGSMKIMERILTFRQTPFTLKIKKRTTEASIEIMEIKSLENRLTHITFPIKNGWKNVTVSSIYRNLSSF